MSTPPDSDQRVAELLRAYLTAEYKWERAGHWHDIVIGLPTPGLELAYPDASSFGILSAWNPWSVERDDSINRAHDETLQAELAAAGVTFVPGFASAPNRTWREPSWLVFGMDETAFDTLARRYGQLGTLWWRPGEPVHLRMDAGRPGGIASEPFVHWLK